MIVVDSNILAYLYLPGEFTVAAEKLLEQDSDWAVPQGDCTELSQKIC